MRILDRLAKAEDATAALGTWAFWSVVTVCLLAVFGIETPVILTSCVDGCSASLQWANTLLASVTAGFVLTYATAASLLLCVIADVKL